MSRLEPAEKRAAFAALKERAGQGRIVPEKRKSFTGKERGLIHADYDGRCRSCDRLVGLRFEVDHRVPLFRGGKHVRANWELLCIDCHKAKTGGSRLVGACPPVRWPADAADAAQVATWVSDSRMTRFQAGTTDPISRSGRKSDLP